MVVPVRLFIGAVGRYLLDNQARWCGLCSLSQNVTWSLRIWVIKSAGRDGCSPFPSGRSGSPC